MLFLRTRLGSGPVENRPIQFQAAWGTSATFGYDERNRPGPYSLEARELLQGRGYTTLGITVFPHCLFRKAQPPTDGR